MRREAIARENEGFHQATLTPALQGGEGHVGSLRCQATRKLTRSSQRGERERGEALCQAGRKLTPLCKGGTHKEQQDASRGGGIERY
jgi:hypothetical protein